jgi:hypothetical protein
MRFIPNLTNAFLEYIRFLKRFNYYQFHSLCLISTAAAALINDLTTKYGENLVAMSVHAGSFAKPGSSNHNLDLRTSYGILGIQILV